jgi:hypothetical protein
MRRCWGTQQPNSLQTRVTCSLWRIKGPLWSTWTTITWCRPATRHRILLLHWTSAVVHSLALVLHTFLDFLVLNPHSCSFLLVTSTPFHTPMVCQRFPSLDARYLLRCPRAASARISRWTLQTAERKPGSLPRVPWRKNGPAGLVKDGRNHRAYRMNMS